MGLQRYTGDMYNVFLPSYSNEAQMYLCVSWHSNSSLFPGHPSVYPSLCSVQACTLHCDQTVLQINHQWNTDITGICLRSMFLLHILVRWVACGECHPLVAEGYGHCTFLPGMNDDIDKAVQKNVTLAIYQKRYENHGVSSNLFPEWFNLSDKTCKLLFRYLCGFINDVSSKNKLFEISQWHTVTQLSSLTWFRSEFTNTPWPICEMRSSV